MTPSGDCSHAPHVLANSWGAGAPPIPSSVFHRRRCRFGADELRLQTTGGPCVPCSALSATIRLPRAVEATGFGPDQLRAYSKRLTRLDEPADAELLLQNANSTQTPIHLLQTRNDSLQTPTHWDTGHFFHRLRYAALQELSGAGRLIRRLCEPHSDTPTFSRRCGPLELEKRAAERASWRSAIRQLNRTQRNATGTRSRQQPRELCGRCSGRRYAGIPRDTPEQGARQRHTGGSDTRYAVHWSYAPHLKHLRSFCVPRTV